MKIAELSAEVIHSVPRQVDWTKVRDTELEEAWCWSSESCEKCGTSVPLSSDNPGGGDHCDYDTDLDPDTGCNGWLPLFEGPMMNYWYPIGEHLRSELTPEKAGRILSSTCLCVVRVRDEYGLALTGGGMDLSWEICAAFVALGYLPPIHFAELPKMCGRGTSVEDRRIMKACRRSIVIGMRHLRGKLRGLSSVAEWAVQYANESRRRA